MAKSPKSDADPAVEPEAVPEAQAEPKAVEAERVPEAEIAAAAADVPAADRFPSRGAQVVLDGPAKTAARGGAGGSIEENTNYKRELEAAGEVADGSTPDGSTRTGKPAPDVTGEPLKPTPPVANTDAPKE